MLIPGPNTGTVIVGVIPEHEFMSRDRNNSKSEITVGGPYFDEMAVFYVPFLLEPTRDERSIGFKHGDETDFFVVPSSH